MYLKLFTILPSQLTDSFLDTEFYLENNCPQKSVDIPILNSVLSTDGAKADATLIFTLVVY